MKKSLILNVLVIIVVISVCVSIYGYMNNRAAPVPADVAQNVENYLRANIPALSPVPAVLGGTWYVVSVTTDPKQNSGVVVYEDGHIQETRNFSYVANERGEITSLTIANE